MEISSVHLMHDGVYIDDDKLYTVSKSDLTPAGKYKSYNLYLDVEPDDSLMLFLDYTGGPYEFDAREIARQLNTRLASRPKVIQDKKFEKIFSSKFPYTCSMLRQIDILTWKSHPMWNSPQYLDNYIGFLPAFVCLDVTAELGKMPADGMEALDYIAKAEHIDGLLCKEAGGIRAYIRILRRGECAITLLGKCLIPLDHVRYCEWLTEKLGVKITGGLYERIRKQSEKLRETADLYQLG